MGEFDDLIPGQRTGYIPGVPKAKDPLDVEAKTLDIEGKRLDIADKQRKATQPNSGAAITENESKSSMFLRRMLGSNQEYDTLGQGPRGWANEGIADVAPGLMRNLPERMGGDNLSRKQADRAMRDFIGASLRYESGASINKDEFAKQLSIFYPHSGEESDTLKAAYKEARKRAIEGMIAATGRAMTPELQKAVDDWRASQGAAPEGRDVTPGGQAILEPGESGAQLATGAEKTEGLPELAGTNGFILAAVKGGASSREILAALKDRGMSTQDLVGIAPQLAKVIKFRDENPAFKGDYKVDVEGHQVPTSAFERFAASGPGAGLIAAGDSFSGGHLDNIVGVAGGDAEDASAKIDAARAGSPGYSLAGDVAAGIGLYGAGSGLAGRAGLSAGSGALSPTALAGDAALGGYVSSGQGGTQIADPANVAMGAFLGAGAGAGGRSLINGAASAISPTGGELAPLYAAGVRPTIGQRAGGIVNRAEQAFTSLPGVGGIQRAARSGAIDEMQTGAFNQALGEIGLQLPKGIKKGVPAHKFMQKAFDDVYDRARSGMQFAPDGEWAKDLGALQKDANLLNDGSRGIFNKILYDAGSKLRSSGGTLDGEQYKLVVSRIGKKIASLRSSPSGDGELADALESLRGAIDGAARRQSNPNAVALLDAADRGYAKAVVIENAARMRGGEPGEFGGVSLDRAVQTSNKSRRSRAYLRGEAAMQPYATAARKLGENVADSGTTERLLTNGGMAAGASAVTPYAMIPWAADTLATLPGARQTLGAVMSPRSSPALQRAADELRRRAYLASIGAAPAAIEGQ